MDRWYLLGALAAEYLRRRPLSGRTSHHQRRRRKYPFCIAHFKTLTIDLVPPLLGRHRNRKLDHNLTSQHPRNPRQNHRRAAQTALEKHRRFLRRRVFPHQHVLAAPPVSHGYYHRLRPREPAVPLPQRDVSAPNDGTIRLVALRAERWLFQARREELEWLVGRELGERKGRLENWRGLAGSLSEAVVCNASIVNVRVPKLPRTVSFPAGWSRSPLCIDEYKLPFRRRHTRTSKHIVRSGIWRPAYISALRCSEHGSCSRMRIQAGPNRAQLLFAFCPDCFWVVLRECGWWVHVVEACLEM